MDPPLTVNFQGSPRLRYLQVGIQLMAYDAKAFDPVRQHMPVVRNNLIMLLSAKTYDELISREGKEALREEALQEIRKILEERAGNSGIEAVYFTSFVMQ
jgi:flagellar FliL protein